MCATCRLRLSIWNFCIGADGKGVWRRLDETEDSGGDDHTLYCNPKKSHSAIRWSIRFSSQEHPITNSRRLELV